MTAAREERLGHTSKVMTLILTKGGQNILYVTAFIAANYNDVHDFAKIFETVSIVALMSANLPDPQ